MPLGGRKCLGLALEESRIAVAEVSVSGGKAILRHAEEFAFPEGASLADAHALGLALRQFLRERRFSSSQAVLGVPARWVVAREKRFPPADMRALAEMARLEVERAFATAADHLVADCALNGKSAQGGACLLAAMPRERLTQAADLTQAAGLRLKGVSPTVAALAETLGGSARDAALLVLLRPGQSEAALLQRGRASAMKSLPLPAWPGGTHEAGAPPDAEANAEAGPAPDVALSPPAGAERAFREALAQSLAPLAAASDGEGPEPAALAFYAWDGLNLGDEPLRQVAEAVGTLAPTRPRLADLGLKGEDAETEGAGRFLGAAALALQGARDGELSIDFLHSRLAKKKERVNARRVAWAATLATVAVASVGMLALEWRREEGELQSLRARLEALAPEVEAAQDMVDRVVLARGWTDRRPRSLDVLRELAEAFPQEDPVWATSVTIREDRRVGLTGSAAGELTVFQLRDSIAARPAFKNVKLEYWRGPTGTNRDGTFSMTFDYVGKAP